MVHWLSLDLEASWMSLFVKIYFILPKAATLDQQISIGVNNLSVLLGYDWNYSCKNWQKFFSFLVTQPLSRPITIYCEFMLD